MANKLPPHMRNYSLNRFRSLIQLHNSGDPEWQLDEETYRIVIDEIDERESVLADAYEKDDPKHPTYRERMLDAADMARKSRREDF